VYLPTNDPPDGSNLRPPKPTLWDLIQGIAVVAGLAVSLHEISQWK
jgi:hypothetical protein